MSSNKIATMGDISTMLKQVEDKMMSELNSTPSQPYEALQYVQSFLARKKKVSDRETQSLLSITHTNTSLQHLPTIIINNNTNPRNQLQVLGQMNTSSFVFHGATLLANNNAASSAAILLTWFIEDGAGVEYKFKLQSNPLDASNYCDVQRLIDFLSKLDSIKAAPIADQIFNPIHIVIAQKRVEKDSALSKRVRSLEASLAKTCEASKKWLFAFKYATYALCLVFMPCTLYPYTTIPLCHYTNIPLFPLYITGHMLD